MRHTYLFFEMVVCVLVCFENAVLVCNGSMMQQRTLILCCFLVINFGSRICRTQKILARVFEAIFFELDVWYKCILTEQKGVFLLVFVFRIRFSLDLDFLSKFGFWIWLPHFLHFETCCDFDFSGSRCFRHDISFNWMCANQREKTRLKGVAVVPRLFPTSCLCFGK